MNIIEYLKQLLNDLPDDTHFRDPAGSVWRKHPDGWTIDGCGSASAYSVLHAAPLDLILPRLRADASQPSDHVTVTVVAKSGVCAKYEVTPTVAKELTDGFKQLTGYVSFVTTTGYATYDLTTIAHITVQER